MVQAKTFAGVVKVGSGSLYKQERCLTYVVVVDILYIDRHDSVQLTSSFMIHNANMHGIKIGTGTVLQFLTEQYLCSNKRNPWSFA